MSNVTVCPAGWTTRSELSTLDGCNVPILGTTILKLGVAILAAIALVIEISVFGRQYFDVVKKNRSTLTLLIWTIIQNIIMAMRPVLGYSLNMVPATTLWLAFITHVSAALAAGIVVLFIFIQIKILAKSAMGKTNWLYRHKKLILIILGTLQAVLFVIGPFIAYGAGISLHLMFWSPVIIVDFTIIPYFCTLGIMLYIKITKMKTNNKKKANRLITSIVLCSVLGLFTGVVGIYSVMVNTYEWALIELCWLADIVFNVIFFFLFAKTKSSKMRSTVVTTGSR
jgi:hypothetical protein